MQPPRLEADDAAAGVGEREEQAALEVVVAACAGQARGVQLLGGEALLARLAREQAASGCEAEPKLAADLLRRPRPAR